MLASFYPLQLSLKYFLFLTKAPLQPLDFKAPLTSFSLGCCSYPICFLFGFLKGKSLRECGLLGDLMARFVITQAGARSGFPSPAQLSQKYLAFQLD